MRRDHTNGYLGWTVHDCDRNAELHRVAWIDVEACEYAQQGKPLRVVNGEIRVQIVCVRLIVEITERKLFVINPSPGQLRSFRRHGLARRDD